MKIIKILIICILFWNLPFFLYRVYKSRIHKKKVKYYQDSNSQLLDLPREILYKILKNCGVIEIYRLGACSKTLYTMTSDKILWEKKFYWDFHSKTPSQKLDLNYKLLYKARYLLSESRSQREIRLGLKGIIDSEFHLGIFRTWHLALIPLKLLGFLSLPFYYFLERQRPNLSPSISSLELLLHDIIIYGSKCINFQNYHLLFLLVLTSIILGICHGISLAFYFVTLIFYNIFQILSNLSRHLEVFLSFLLILYQISLFFLPLYLKSCMNLSCGGLVCGYCVWTPIFVCNAEYSALVFRNTTLGGFFKNWTFALQLLFGIEAYFLFSTLSVIEGVGNYPI